MPLSDIESMQSVRRKFMKRSMKILALMLCAGALILLGGCQQSPEETTAPTTIITEPPLTAVEKYDLAKAGVDQAANWILNYTTEESRMIGKDTYTETVTGTASFSKLYQQDMTAVVEEQLTYGSYSSAYTEVYCGGAAYAQVNGSNFTAEMDAADFVQRQLPAALLDSSLYQTITESTGENTTVVSFSDAAGLETWLAGSDAELICAAGTATLDSTGVLMETTYQAEFIQGDARYSYSAVVRITVPQTLELGATHQEHFEGSVSLESLDIPKMLLQVVGDVYTSQYMYCDANETIYSEAIPTSYTQRGIFHLTGGNDELWALAEYQISGSDYRGEVYTKTQTDRFEDGLFTTTQDNGEPVENTSMTAQLTREYCEDAILSALVAPKYLAAATLQDNGDHYRLEMTGNEAFMADLMAGIIDFLDVDLDAKATTSETLSIGGYLTIDKATRLPITMGLYLERTHTIEDVPYVLSYQLDHTLILSLTEDAVEEETAPSEDNATAPSDEAV